MRLSRGRRKAGLLCSALSLALAVGGVQPSGGDELIARWSEGTVSAADYAEWVEASGAGENASVEGYVLTQWLANQAIARGVDTEPSFRARMRRLEEQRKGALLQQALRASIEITEAELDALQVTYPDAFRKPWRRRVRNLFKRAPHDGDPVARESARAEMERLRGRVLEGVDFAELAAAHSDSQTRFRGGNLGLVKPGVLPAAVEAVVLALSAGDVSRVLATKEGFVMFFCPEVLPAEEPSSAEVREKFTVNLRKERFTELWAEIEAGVEASALEIHTERVGVSGASLVDGTDPPIDTYDLEAALALRPVGAELKPGGLHATLERLARSRLIARDAEQRGVVLAEKDIQELAAERLEALALDELTRRVNSRVERPNEADVRRYFNEHASEFTVEPEMEVSVLRIDLDDEDPVGLREAFQLASDLAATLASQPSRFSELAREYSDLPSATEGGYLGWLPRRRLFGFGPNISRVMDGLGVGEVSPEVRERGGFWIAKLEGLRSARLMTFGEASEVAEKRLGQERVEAIRLAVEEELLAALEVESASSP